MTKKLLAHFIAMQGMAQRALLPDAADKGYTSREGLTMGGSGGVSMLFSSDMIYMLDGPEQREAQTEAEAEFDYVAETDVTASGMDGRQNVTRDELGRALEDFAQAAARLDLFKKVLFRGRSRAEAGLNELDASRSTPLSICWSVQDLDLLHGIIGAATESGELAEIAIKYLHVEAEPDTVNVREEVGDVLWYLSRLVKWADTTFDAEMRRNIAKLRARHKPTGFDRERDINRDHAAERHVLEGLKDGHEVTSGYAQVEGDKLPSVLAEPDVAALRREALESRDLASGESLAYEARQLDKREQTQFADMNDAHMRDSLGLPLEGTKSTPRHHVGNYAPDERKPPVDGDAE